MLELMKATNKKFRGMIMSQSTFLNRKKIDVTENILTK